MKKKVLRIAIPIIIILVIALSYFIYRWTNRVRYNETYVNGNTAGNLYNNGLFCESNGVVFFSNPDDSGKLYSMDADGSNVKKVCDDTVRSINADDHYVYYVRYNEQTTQDYEFFSYNKYSLCRIKRNGGQLTILDPDPCLNAVLVGNYIYYLHYDTTTATTFYKIKIDGTEKTQLMDTYAMACSPLGQYLYYNGHIEDGCIYEYDTAVDSSRMVYECDAYNPIVTSDNNVYYMDVKHNYALVHTNMNFDKPTVITRESIDCFNVYGSTIFYQVFDKDSPYLARIKNDGSEEEIIARGTFTDINVTSHYIYFKEFSSGKIFFAPIGNPTSFQQFRPGK